MTPTPGLGPVSRALGRALTAHADRRAARRAPREEGPGLALHRRADDAAPGNAAGGNAGGSPADRATRGGATGGIRYHLDVGRLGSTPPTGLVVYLDGDYWLPSLSRFHSPRGRTMRGLAAAAAEHGAALLAVDTPDRAVGLAGFTWWVRHRENAEALVRLVRRVARELPTPPGRVWLMGYSGGAELIGFELPRLVEGLAQGAGGAGAGRAGESADDEGRAAPALRVAGAVMVGGGGPSGDPGPPPAGAAGLPLLWWVGDRDGSPRGSRLGWSAAAAARRGARAYRGAGWAGVVLRVVPRATHRSYDLPAILRESLASGGPADRG